MVSQPRLRIALIGLGRLGMIRARILAFQQPRIELVAVCDTRPGAHSATVGLPGSVQFFADPEDCLRNSGCQGVLISTSTATHAPLICMALDLGLHVMCEKPISVDLAATEAVITKAADHPHLVTLIPFTRRYDDSHRAAKLLAKNGELGEIHAVEATCVDQQDPQSFFVSFSAQSGGIFLDCGIHTIDIGRYFLDVQSGLDNPKRQVKRVFAVGQQAVYTELEKYGDSDCAWGIVEFENGKVLTTHLGRTLTNGFESSTRILGTKGHTLINPDSAINRSQIRDAHGVRTLTCPDAFTLFEKTFVSDVTEFANAVLDNASLTCTLADAYEAQKIAIGLQHSFRTRQPVFFDNDGRPILNGVKSIAQATDLAHTGNGTMNGIHKANGYSNGHASFGGDPGSNGVRVY